MEVGKVSIITRARNRLEYTTQVVAAVRANTRYENYEHIVINQDSTDGTRQWLDWITAMPNGWYHRVRAIHSPENTGDWGGMLASLSHISGESKYIVQLDNDILVSEGWLSVIVEILDLHVDATAVMLKRTGVQNSIEPNGWWPCLLHDDHVVGIGVVPKVVACYVCEREVFAKHAPSLTGCGQLVASTGGKALKILDPTCHQIEGFTGVGQPYVQHEKYGESEKRI